MHLKSYVLKDPSCQVSLFLLSAGLSVIFLKGQCLKSSGLTSGRLLVHATSPIMGMC